MARLIPQKQIEEVNIFRDSISVGNSVFISGSLLVSQSINIGSDLQTKQTITGSVEITGSLNIDGNLSFANAQSRLDATSSFSEVSVDTQQFGGIPVSEFAGNDSTIYVSATRGDDSNDGRSLQFPVRTIKRAAQLATPGDDGRYGLPTGSNFTGFRIDVQAGTYVEDNPIELPRNTTVWGAGLRVSKVVAANENEDLFWVNSGCYLAEMTFGGLRVFPSVDDSQKGFAISFAPNAFITTSPYIQNCSMISNQENSFLEAYEEIPPGGGGLNVDGNRIHPDSPLASMVLDAYTQVAPNGVGCQVVGRGFIQLVSFFTNFSAYAVKVIDGGQAVLLNSNTSFGDFGMYSSGSRFITGSGGNTEAFLNVQDNYSIIVDTIERGLGEIPDLVPNTNNGVRVTSPSEIPQYFTSGQSATNDDVSAIVSDYRLISNLIERGVEDKLPILALSSDRGYNSGSVWNVSGEPQTTSSVTPSQSDLDSISSNYDIVLDIIDRGNAATSSYTYIDNVSSSIKISDVTQYKSSPVSDITEDTIGERFDTIISIIENGVDFIPEIKSNTSQSFKVTDTSQYITDLTSSLEVREVVSSSLSIVYNILDNGTGSAPTIIQSSSNENPTIDYQNAYTLLIENIPFIQEETIAYLSSSWSEFEYNQTTCKRDVGYIISGAAYDLLYGGNEESVKNGNFYYLYPSDATSTQKEPTLTAIKYVAGMVDNILSDTTFVETTTEADNAYNLLFENKRFIQSESITYVSSSWSTFEYNEAKCVRDLGYIIDAVATDIKYGGNERSVIAGNFYYKYPSQATINNSTVGGQLNQTIDGIKYAKRIAQKLAKNETFVTQSASTLTIADTLLQNRSLIQDETITYINTTYPNFSYNEAKCRRDTGYILDGVITDLRYGGVERSQLSGLYYYLYPSIANTTQLEETLEGIRYSKGFALEVAQSNLIEIPTAKRNIEKRIKVGDVQYITSSISGTEFESKHISGSIGIVEDIIRFGSDSVLASIAENTGSFDWSISSPINVSSVLPITSSATESANIQNVSDGFDIVTSIIAGGESAIPQPTSSWEGTIKVTDTPQYISSSLSSTSTEATLVSQSIAIVANIVQNGVDSLPPLTASIDGLIKVTNESQNTDYSGSFTEANKVSSSFSTITNIVENGTSVIPTITSNVDSAIKFYSNEAFIPFFTASNADVSFVSSSISFVTDIIANGTGSYTASNYVSASTEDSTLDAYSTLINSIPFIQSESIAYLSSSWSTASYDESKCRRDIGLIISGAAEDLLYGVVSASVVNGKFYYEYPSQAQGAQLEQTLDGVFYASRLAQKLIKGVEFSLPSSASLGAWNAINENIDFIKEETISYLSSSWSTFDYNETTCKRDVGYVLDAVKTDILYGGNERSVIAGNFYYKYPSQATGSQINQTLDGLRYAGDLVQAIVTGSVLSFPSQAVLDTKGILENNKQFIKDETIAYISSSWSEFSYDQITCKRDIGFILDAAITDIVYGGNQRGRIAANFYYKYPSAAIVGGVPSATQQKDPTVDAIKYVGGISEKIVLGETFTSADSTKITIKNSIIDNKSNVQQQTIDYINDTYPNLNYNNDKCFRDVGFIIDAVVTDLVYGGNGRSVQAGAFYYRFPSQATYSQLSETVDGINFARDLIKLDLRGANSVEDSFDTVIKIIESGSSIVTEETIGTGSAPVPESQIGDPISTIGIPKDSYGDGLVTTVTTTSIPTFDLVENTSAGIKFGNDTQITSSLSASSAEISKVSESFSDVIDIIRYGTSGSLTLSGSYDTTTYYEVITPETGNYYILNRAQLDEFDGVRAGGYFNPEENTGSFSDGIKDPTLTLKRGEMYTFSVNALKYDLNPFYIKTARRPNKEALYNEGVTNNGVNFGTLTFIVPLEAPDRLYYVNGNNVSASGIINVVDNLPLSDTQKYIEVPSRGFVEVVTNNAEGIKISDIEQYKSIYTASVDESNEISSSYATVIDILGNGLSVKPTLVENTIDLIGTTNSTQSLSSISASSYEVDLVSSSFAVMIDVLRNGTGSLPTEVSNTSASIKVTDVPQYISSSVSGNLENVEFVSQSVSIVYNILENSSSSSYTATQYDTGSGAQTGSATIAAYQIIRNNLEFIQSETLAYLSSSWTTGSYNEASCSRDVGLIISGAAEDLIWNTTSASVVNGKFYLEYPSQAETSQLNQTLDGIEYASKLTQKLIQNVEFVNASSEASASHHLLLDNKEFIQNETIAYISSSWSGFDYSETLCRRDIGHIIDATATDVLYGGNERVVQAASFYYSNPSAATGSQLNQTVDAINYARRLSENIIQSNEYTQSSVQSNEVAKLITENKELIKEETIQFLSSSWSTFEYDEEKCRRDTGYIIDAVVTDFIYGGNERSITAGEFYYLYPSDATGSQLVQTVDGITYAQRLTNKLVNNVNLVTASLERLATKELLLDNKSLIQNEVIHFISSSWSEFDYIESKCKRDVGFILDAVITDTVYGGNERSVVAGEFYYRYPSEATTTQLDQTITGVKHAAGLASKVIQNSLLVNPDSDVLESYNRIRNNKLFIQSEVIEFIDNLYPYFTYNRVKCKRDVGFIVDAVATDLLWGGNERSIIAGDYYYRFPSEATTFQLDQTIGGIRYAKALTKDVILNKEFERPRIIFNNENHIKVDGVPQYNGSMAISGSNLTEISSSFEIINNIISGGLSQLPIEVKSIDSLTKVTDTLQITQSYSGSDVQIGIISSSIDMINDIIRFGSDDIPFTIAKHFQTSELNTPQQLTTSSYVTVSGDYVVTDEKEIVSESFSLINDIIENTTSSIADFVDNTYNKRKFTNTTQYSSSVSASETELSIVDNRFGIVVDIVENGLSQKPTIVRNNTDVDNLIKVTDTPQYISASAADKLQSKIVSSSIAIVTDIIENGSGSAPTIIEYTTPSDSPKAKLAYQLIKNNLPFIVSESIAYISSSWSDFSYNEASCSRDVALIVSGAAEDLIWNSNSASVVNGKFYLEYPSAATGSQLQQTLDGINYASTLTQHIVRNRTFVTASSAVSASYNLLVENKEFIQNETIAYLSSSWSDFYYSESKCKRDVGYIIDAVATDLKYGGNERSVIAGDYYYRFPSAAIVGGVPNVDQQKDPTVTGINYVKSLANELLSGSRFVTASNEVEFVYDSIRENREFIQAETVAFVNAKYPNLQYNEASCSRDTGFIVDAVATDLRWGGNQRSIVAGQYYYKFPSQATTTQLGETTDAIIYASNLVSELIDKNTLPIPSASLNTDNNIKVTGVTQYTGSISASQSDVDFISSSIDVVTTIVVNGTGSYETAGTYVSPSTDPNTLAAYEILRNNIGFIQSESIAYLSSSWADFEYNESKCSRDIGLIISGAAEDLVWNVVSASIVNGKFYYEYPSQANGTGSQVEQTLDGIFYASRLAQKLVQNIEFVEPSTEASSSWELIRSNKQFIKDETIAYISSSWSDFAYNEASCSRDVGHILNAVSTDILYGGNERSITAGNFYYKYPSSATTTQLNPTITGINYAGDIAENVIVNNVFENASAERIAGNESLLNNRTFIQSESLAYLTASWSTFEYDKDKCARDVGHIVDAVATDFLYGGNERSRTAGEFYYLYPSEATTTQANQTTDGVKYAGRIAEALVQNIQFVTASAEVSASFDLLRKNKPFIAEEVIQYVSSSWSGVYYDEAKCRRDTGFIVDAAATDLLYGGNERSVIAGNYYFKYPSSATERGVPSVVSQLDPTTTGIKYASGLAQNVIQNVEWYEPSASVLIASDLLLNNKTLIQKETIEFLSSSWSEFPYNDVSCSRDLGYIIDAVRTDLVYGGNERSIQAATFYYYIPSVAITEQKPQTIDGIDFAKGMAEQVVNQNQLTFASLNRRNGYNDLRAAKKYLQSSAISYTTAAFPGFEYNEEKCYRDTGFILDAISTDLLYGGNERSIEAAKSYYNGVYGDASVVINEQKKETAETNRYLRTLFQKVARNAPLELFGSLIITTGHDFSYAGAGVTYKALPPNQGGNGIPDPTKEIVELGGGRVFFTSGNELGDFRIGGGLVIKQASGTLEGRTFSRSLFSLVTPFSLALQD
jgi:hypothetical protein